MQRLEESKSEEVVHNCIPKINSEKLRMFTFITMIRFMHYHLSLYQAYRSVMVAVNVYSGQNRIIIFSKNLFLKPGFIYLLPSK